MLSGIETATIATAAGGGGMGYMLMQLAPFILIFIVFYFLLIRPQQQKMKKHREMIENLRRGDEVVTQGGIVGKITKIADTDATVEIAEGVRVKVIKFTITEVRTRTEPANDAASAKSDTKDGQ
ncbi:MAG: preprotein translocase subunit YajC [Oceanicaulis sp.]